jgi:tetratricopeptide (TPR) repeat protein
MMLALLVWALVAPSAEPARAHFAKGQKLFAEQRYQEALSEFQAAQHAAPREAADLYFNIGQCYRNLGRVRAALDAFERYLELKPDAPDRKQVKKMLTKLRARLSPDANAAAVPENDGAASVHRGDESFRPTEPAAAVPDPLPEPTPPAERGVAVAVKLDLAQRASPHPTVAQAAIDLGPEPPHLYEKWWFWAGVGVAVLGTSVGLYAGLRHNSTSPSMIVTGTAGTFDTRGGH